MDQSHHRLATQAWLLILITSSFLMGISSLLIGLVPHFPLPPQWQLSTVGAIALLLVSLGLLTLLRDWPQRRRLIGGLVMALGALSLGHHLLVPATDNGLSSLTGHSQLSPLPASLLLMIGACYLLPPELKPSRRCYRLVGWLWVGVGVVTLMYPLTSTLPPSSVAGMTSLGSVFFLLLGIGLLMIGRQRVHLTMSLPRTAIKVGVLGVTVSIMIWLASSWMQYNARLTDANNLVGNIAEGMAQRIERRVGMIERLATRWQTMREQPDQLVQQIYPVETRTYLDDEPSFQALAYLGPELQTWWRVGREPENLSWLMDQLAEPATRGWLNQQDEQSRRVSWRFPDPAHSSHGLLAVTLDSGQSTMLATIDFAEIIGLQRYLDTGGFNITYTSQDNTWGSLHAHKGHEGITLRTFASHEVTLPGGPTFTITAMNEPLPLTSLLGALPVIFGLLGLLFTYQLIISRALVAIRDSQATALQRSEQRFRSLFTQHPDAVFAHNKDGTYESLNPVTEAIAGLSEDKLLRQHFRTVVCEAACSKQDVQRTESAFQRAVSGFPNSYTMCMSRVGNAPQHLDVTMVPIVVDGKVDGVFGIAKDITARIIAEERLHILERSLEASSNGAVIVDVREEGKPVVYVNPAFTRITGYLEQEVIGHAPVFLTGDETAPEDIEQIQAAIRLGNSLSTTFRAYRRDGKLFWNQLFLSPVRDSDQNVTHFIGIMNDISERKEQESQLAYQATHDVLTGLGNRALFSDRLAHDVELSVRHGQTLAVLFIDLDEFKPINDTLGHRVGDQLLISVTDRLRQGLRTSDTLARLGGDEFVLLLPDLGQSSEAEDVATRLLEDLNKPYRVHGHELHVSASIGIAVNSGAIDDPERLLQHADMAMYKAKQQGRNTYQLYTEDLDSKLSLRVMLRSELQDAIEHGHLSLHYQPLMDREGHVDGLEALVRWHHPTKGFISPATFIPIAEETGQIIPLSRWVMKQACQDARQLVAQGLLSGRMAINLSPLQFHRPNFLSTLRNVLNETDLAPAYLELELTEGILMRDTDGAIDTLHALNSMDVSTSIDDFGTGYSSLSYLRDLPIDKIKIDRSFVKDASKSDKNAAICRGIITLAQDLDLRVVAEGIETVEQHDYQMSLGCEVFQGYLFAKPMPLDSLTTWLTLRAQASPFPES